MSRVVLISTSFREQEELEKVHSEAPASQFTFETTASFAQDPSFWNQVEVLILNIPSEPIVQSAFVNRLRDKIPNHLKVLILTQEMSSPVLQLSQVIPRVRILKLPTNGYSLYRTLVDITTEYPVGQQQVHPRYLTDLPISVRSELKSIQIPARMKNLSIGGAYFEVQAQPPPIATGDLVRLMIQMPGGKNYEFDAKVVWSTESDAKKEAGFGCAFLDKEQVYDNLLAQMS